MERKVFIAVAITLSLGPFLARGRCQGSAEYSITTSHATSATVKAGSALDKATQRLAGRLQQKLSKPTEQSRLPSRVPGDHAVPEKAQTIESAKGMSIIYGSADAKTSDTKQKAGSESNPCVSSPEKNSSRSKANLPCRPEPQEKYPSVVNLSFSK